MPSLVTELDRRSLSSLRFWCVLFVWLWLLCVLALGVVLLFAVFLQCNRDGGWTTEEVPR